MNFDSSYLSLNLQDVKNQSAQYSAAGNRGLVGEAAQKGPNLSRDLSNNSINASNLSNMTYSNAEFSSMLDDVLDDMRKTSRTNFLTNKVMNTHPRTFNRKEESLKSKPTYPVDSGLINQVNSYTKEQIAGETKARQPFQHQTEKPSSATMSTNEKSILQGSNYKKELDLSVRNQTALKILAGEPSFSNDQPQNFNNTSKSKQVNNEISSERDKYMRTSQVVRPTNNIQSTPQSIKFNRDEPQNKSAPQNLNDKFSSVLDDVLNDMRKPLLKRPPSIERSILESNTFNRDITNSSNMEKTKINNPPRPTTSLQGNSETRSTQKPKEASSRKTNSDEELADFLGICDNEDEDPIFVQHQQKIETHEKTIELLRSKQRKSKNDIERLEVANMKLKELTAQKTEYDLRIKQIIDEARQRFEDASSNGLNAQQVIDEAQRKHNIEKQRLKLAFPIYAKKSEITKLVENNQFLILIGETGSGKSTQLVQYMLESPFIQKSGKMIVCVQPRKLAVQTVSKRVAEELQTTIGGLVGYQTGLKDYTRKSTKIKFTTDRLFLNELLADRSLKNYSCVIIDEAHERNINTDILLSFIKQAAGLNLDLRFIITSATLNKELFVNYFKCKSIEVPGRTYPVECTYYPPKMNQSSLEAIENLIREIIDARENPFKEDKWKDDFQSGGPSSTGEDREIEREGVREDGEFSTEGHILAFVSGIDEIESLIQRFEAHTAYHDKYIFLPLHGRLLPEEQRRVFAADPLYMKTKVTKVIFSTRIAETAITINDVSVVIDIGYDRDQKYDQKKRLTMMVEQPITQAQANQRAGRAGRTRPGRCFRVYSLEEFEQMEPYKVPELKRLNLDQAVLKLKQFAIKDVMNFDFIERPEEITLEQAIDNLKLLGALDEGERITNLGEQMGMLPTDPAISRVVIEAISRKCEQQVCKIIALMTFSGNLFMRGSNFNDWESSDRLKYDFCHPTGDLMTFLQVFEKWESQKGRDKKHFLWCRKNALNPKCLKQAEEMYEEIKIIAELIKKRGTAIDSFFDFEIAQKRDQAEMIKKGISDNAADFLAELQNNCSLIHRPYFERDNDLELDEDFDFPSGVDRSEQNITQILGNLDKQDEEEEYELMRFSAPQRDQKNEKSFESFEKNQANKQYEFEREVKYPEYLELDEKSINILRCFLCAFFPNLALFSGYHELGYTFLREDRLIRIHGASSLNLQSIYPKWIVTGEVQVINDYNCTKIASYVDINWIKELIPRKFLEKYNIAKLESQPIYKSISFSELGSFIMQNIKNGKGDLLKQIKEKYNTYFEVDELRDQIKVWTYEKDVKEVQKMMVTLLEGYRQQSRKKTIERSVAPAAIVRAIIGAGGETKQLLLGDKFRKIDFYNLPIIEEDVITEAFGIYGTVEWVEVHKIINDQVSNGEIVFKDPKDAKTAFEELKTKYDVRMSTAKGRMLSTNLKVIFKWFSGTSERRGLIKYENLEIAALVTEQMKNLMSQEKRVLDGSKIYCELGRKTLETIIVSNLSHTTDDVSLKKFFKKRFPSYKILTACVFRHKDFKEMIAEGQDEITLEETMKNLADSPNDIVKFEVLPHKENDKNKISHRAELFTKNEEFANHLIQNLDQKVGFIGKGRVHVELSRSRTWRMDMRTYEVLKDELGNTIRELQKKLGESAEIAILGGEEAGQQSKKNKYQSPALRIRSGSKLKLEYLMSQFQKILLGYSYHLNNKAEIQKMSRKEGNDFCKKLQAEGFREE